MRPEPSKTRPGRMATRLGPLGGLVLALALLQRLPQGAHALAAWEKLWTAPNPPPAPGNLTSTAPANRQSHGMALWGANELVVHGGVGAERAGLSDLWSFNLETREWAPVGQGAQAYFRAAHSFFVVPEAAGAGTGAGGLYMWGGRDMPNGDANAGSTAATNALLKFAPATAGSLQDGGAWEPVVTAGTGADGAIPDGRCDHTGELYTDPATGAPSLLVYGGRVIEANDNSIARLVFGDVWSLDLASKQWTLLSAGTTADAKDKTQPAPRFLHASAMVNATTLAVFGGLTFYGSSLFALDDVWLFDLPTRAWRQHKMEVPLLRSALPMALSTIGAPPPDAAPGTSNANDPAALVQVPALCAFGGYVIYTNAGLAVVYNDLLVWNPLKGYWEKFAADKSLPAPQPRFDHRGVLWKGTTLVFYGGSYQSVNDVGDVWMLDTAALEPQQLVKAPAEGINALFYGRLLFIFASLLTLCFFSLCFSLRMRMNIMQRARLAEQQQQAQLAAAGMAGGPNGAMDAATRAERERQTEEALRLLPVIPYQRPAPRSSRSAAAAAAAAATGAGAEGGAALGTAVAAEEDLEEEEDRDDTCAICLSTYEPRDPLRCLPCGHKFHRDCCDQWLRTSLTCPLCKTCASPHVAESRVAGLSSASTTASDAGLLPPAAEQQPPQPQPRVMNLFTALNPFRSGSTPRNGSGGGGGATAASGASTPGAASAATSGAPSSAPGSSGGAGGMGGGSSSASPSPSAAAAAAAAAAPPQTTITFFPVPQPAPAGPAGGGAGVAGGHPGQEEGVLNTPYTEMQDLVTASSPAPTQPSPFATAVAAAPAPASPARRGGPGAGAAASGAAAQDMEEGRAGDRREGGSGGAAGSGGAGDAGGTVSLV